MSRIHELDATSLLRRVAEQVPEGLRANVVVIGSIASAWAFRDISGTHSVATKDIDLLLQPAVDAVTTAEMLGQDLLDRGWTPRFPNGIQPGCAATPADALPALRLSPPAGAGQWFVELLAAPPADQTTRKRWRRFHTDVGDFGLPSFRYLRVAVHDAEETPFGLRVARPACMALAHLLEHAVPDTTPISGLPGTPPRFTKDVGRAIALWWLAREQSPLARDQWLALWRDTLSAQYPDEVANMRQAARAALVAVADYLRKAHTIARSSILAPHGTTLEAFRRAHAGLLELVDAL